MNYSNKPEKNQKKIEYHFTSSVLQVTNVHSEIDVALLHSKHFIEVSGVDMRNVETENNLDSKRSINDF